MSKRKLRFRNKFNDIRNSFHNDWYDNMPHVKIITKFDCDQNGIYAQCIQRYKTYPFRIHDLWIEIVDANTSALVCLYNKNILRDLGPFWGMCDTERWLQGKTDFKHYEFNSVDEAYKHYVKEYEYAEYPTPREKYLQYRKNLSEKNHFDWQLKKDALKFSKLSKKQKRYYANKTKYTWDD